LDDPFVGQTPRSRNGNDLRSSPLKSTFLAYEAIVQRGKGGVYRALDTSVSPMRLCVLKEGRKHGETDWDGRDGFWWAKHEQQVLASLKANSIVVPEVYAAFEVEENYYLAMEYVKGHSLRRLLSLKRTRMEIAEVLRLGAQLARLLERIHKAGWVWRDCKPSNLIVTRQGKLVPLDFEGACRVSEPDPMPWGTPGYVPFANLSAIGAVSGLPDDLYALGAVLHQLITGRIPSVTSPQRFLRRAGRRVPRELIAMTLALLSRDPESRPSAAEAARVLARLS
jgi:serine/threonine protein kinase